MHSILPNQERARRVVLIFYINILLTGVLAAAQWWQADLVRPYINASATLRSTCWFEQS